MKRLGKVKTLLLTVIILNMIFTCLKLNFNLDFVPRVKAAVSDTWYYEDPFLRYRKEHNISTEYYLTITSRKFVYGDTDAETDQDPSLYITANGTIILTYSHIGVNRYYSKSTDGETWTFGGNFTDLVNTTFATMSYCNVIKMSNGKYLLVACHGVDTQRDIYCYVSDDGWYFENQTAIETSNITCVFPMNVELQNNDILVSYYDLDGALIYVNKSSDFGQTWTALSTFDGGDPRYAQIHQLPNGTLFLLWWDGLLTDLCISYARSNDNGATWSPRATFYNYPNREDRAFALIVKNDTYYILVLRQDATLAVAQQFDGTNTGWITDVAQESAGTDTEPHYVKLDENKYLFGFRHNADEFNSETDYDIYSFFLYIGKEFTNYQMRITIINGTGTDSENIMYTTNVAQSNFDDVRFTWYNSTSGQEEEIDYWCEEVNNGINATFWIEIPKTSITGITTIYVYYGNDQIGTASNGDDTFIFFDDFDGTSLNTTKWIEENYGGSGTVTVSGGICTLYNKMRIINTVNMTLNTATVIKAKVDAFGSGKYHYWGVGRGDGSGYNIWIAAYSGEKRFYSMDGVTQTYEASTYPDPATYRLWEIKWKSGHGLLNVDGVNYNDKTTNIPPDSASGKFCSASLDATLDDYLYIDYVFNRKWIDPEPDHAEWGDEEQRATPLEVGWNIFTVWSVDIGKDLETICANIQGEGVDARTVIKYNGTEYRYDYGYAANAKVKILASTDELRVYCLTSGVWYHGYDKFSWYKIFEGYVNASHVLRKYKAIAFYRTVMVTVAVSSWTGGEALFIQRETLVPEAIGVPLGEKLFQFTQSLNVATQFDKWKALLLSVTEQVNPLSERNVWKELVFSLNQIVNIALESTFSRELLFKQVEMTQTETVTSEGTVLVWREILVTFEGPLSVSALSEALREKLFTVTEFIVESVTLKTWREKLFWFSETTATTDLIEALKEKILTAVEFFETVIPTETHYLTFAVPKEEVNLALVIACLAFVLSVVALSSWASKE